MIGLIGGGADVDSIASATSDAAEASLAAYTNDPTVRQAFFLLARIPLAAREDNFAGALRKLGLAVDDAPNLMGICAAMIQAVDRKAVGIEISSHFFGSSAHRAR